MYWREKNKASIIINLPLARFLLVNYFAGSIESTFANIS